jgi:Lrp/AsnC family leucine-responsive transcriptional regulator
MKIDSFDISILKIMQGNSKIKSETIAETVGLSATACQRRIKRLRDSGVIESEIAVLKPNALGGWVSLVVQIVLERGGAQTVDQFKKQMRDTPEVQQCFYVTGEYDFVLIVVVRDMSAYELLTRQLFFENPLIRKFNTIVSMETVKRGLALPL